MAPEITPHRTAPRPSRLGLGTLMSPVVLLLLLMMLCVLFSAERAHGFRSSGTSLIALAFVNSDVMPLTFNHIKRLLASSKTPHSYELYRTVTLINSDSEFNYNDKLTRSNFYSDWLSLKLFIHTLFLLHVYELAS